MVVALLVSALLGEAGPAATGINAGLPARASLRQVEGTGAAVERRDDAPSVALAVVRGASVRDPRDGTTYAAACGVYVQDGSEPDAWARRLVVHAPDDAYLPLARRAGRLAATVWRTANHRLGADLGAIRRETVHIWLTRGGDGAETQRGSIYINDASAPRSGLEWLREIAHEYGHYALPGATGYTAPEPWANGLLGERLLLGWIAADLRDRLLSAADCPDVSAADLAEYTARQVTPLTERTRSAAPRTERLAGVGARAADDFTGLMLWAQSVYGPACIGGLLDFLPPGANAGARGDDFLRAIERWVASKRAFATAIPRGTRVWVHLPKGAFTVAGKAGDVARLDVQGAACARRGATWVVRTPAAAWRAVTLTSSTAPAGSDGAVELTWTRQ